MNRPEGSHVSSLRNARASVLFVFLIVVLVTAASVFGAEAAAPKPAEPAAQPAPAAPSAIALSELASQAEAATIDLREIATALANDDTAEQVRSQLPVLARDIELRTRENARIVAQRPSLDLLRTLERGWQRLRRPLALWSGELDARSSTLARDAGRIQTMQSTWQETLALATKEEAAPDLVERVQSMIGSIGATREALDEQRAEISRLQSRVTAQDLRIAEALETIRRARDVMLARIFAKDSPAIWDRAVLSGVGQRVASDSHDSSEAQSVALRTYVATSWDHFALHAAIFLVLAAAFYAARRRVRSLGEVDAALDRAQAVFALPIATALLLSLLGARWIYPQAPRVMWAVIGALALIPAVVVLRGIVAPHLRAVLYAVIAFYFVDQVRSVTASIAYLPRLLLLAEMIGGALFAWWFMRRPEPTTPNSPRHRTRTRKAPAVALIFFVATAIANALGYVALANLLGGAVLGSVYVGAVLYTVVEILSAGILIALRTQPLTRFSMVRRHYELLLRRARFVLSAFAFWLWALFTLDRLAIRERVLRAGTTALTATLQVGSISISLGDVLGFVAVIWGSFALSRFVRFVLDEEIYPHAHLSRGLPYAISQTLHYVILVVGFFLAVAALGFDMTKFTILAGAFTVGVGFGLQNIFNNFVSGLILLFERPLKVGDVIQIEDTTGVVERIGIRACVVRTPSGSEVIVPNGKLIQDRLVNWTLTERERGIDLQVSVQLASDPKRVIDVLEATAAAHGDILKTPPPRAVLVRLGPDWMGFELQAFTHRVEDWIRVRSEIAAALPSALAQANVTLR